MKGFVRQNGRPTKGGSLPGSVGARSARSEEAKQRVGGTPPRLNGESSGNGAISSNDELSSFLRDAIVELVSSESVTSSGSDLVNRARNLSERLDRRTPPQSKLNGAKLNGAELNGIKLNGAEPFHILRWKRILDLTCIFLTLPIWLP